MKNYKDFVDYWENIATQHVDIPHNPPEEKAFFRVNIEELLAGFRTRITKKSIVFMLVDYQYGLEDKGDNNARKKFDGGFIVMGYHKKDDWEEETLIRTQCEDIVDDIIQRVKQESLNEPNDENSFWYGSQDCSDGWQVMPINKSTEINYAGFLVTFNWYNHFDCTVDDAKWNDLP